MGHEATFKEKAVYWTNSLNEVIAVVERERDSK